jgi:hypothetical protein
MKLEKLKKALNGIFSPEEIGLSESQENLVNIIARLQQKKQSIKERMQLAGEQDETSSAYHDLDKEYKVVSKLLKKAKKHYIGNDSAEADDTTRDS